MNNTELLREAVALLKKAHPAINPSAMDTERMTGNPASECWINTMVRSFTESADVQAALASQASKGAGVVESWALVPKEPTQEMKDEIIGCCTDDKLLTARYRAMLRAAPSPAQAQHVGYFVKEGIAWVQTSSDDPRGVKFYADPPAQTQPVEARPVAYADPQAFANFDRVRSGELLNHMAGHEWMWARPSNGLVPMYLGAQPVADAALDKERLDFMEACVMDHAVFRAERDWNPMRDSPTYGDLPTVTVFTVPSQHVKGIGLRAAIDAARAIATKPAE